MLYVHVFKERAAARTRRQILLPSSSSSHQSVSDGCLCAMQATFFPEIIHTEATARITKQGAQVHTIQNSLLGMPEKVCLVHRNFVLRAAAVAISSLYSTISSRCCNRRNQTCLVRGHLACIGQGDLSVLFNDFPFVRMIESFICRDCRKGHKWHVARL